MIEEGDNNYTWYCPTDPTSVPTTIEMNFYFIKDTTIQRPMSYSLWPMTQRDHRKEKEQRKAFYLYARCNIMQRRHNKECHGDAMDDSREKAMTFHCS